MADTRIHDIVKNLQALEASTTGRQALSSPRRGDYNWGEEDPHSTPTPAGASDDEAA